MQAGPACTVAVPWRSAFDSVLENQLPPAAVNAENAQCLTGWRQRR